MRRRSDGSATVAVVVKGRPYQAVTADLIEGIVVANDLAGAEATPGPHPPVGGRGRRARRGGLTG